MSEDKSISVIVNFCEADKQYLGRCIAAIQWQLTPHDELIVVKDSGEEPDFIAEGRKWGRERFAFASSQHLIFWPYQISTGGICRARNAGAAAATKTWLKFMDVDDVMAPFALDALRLLPMDPRIKLLKGGQTTIRNGSRNYELVPSQQNFWMESDAILLHKSWETIKTGNPAIVSATFIDRAGFNEAGGFDDKLDWEEDWDLWLRFHEKFGAECMAATRSRVCYYWVSDEERAAKKRRHEVEVREDDRTEVVDVHEYLRRRYACRPGEKA